jgi:hypothetical protein
MRKWSKELSDKLKDFYKENYDLFKEHGERISFSFTKIEYRPTFEKDENNKELLRVCEEFNIKLDNYLKKYNL